MGSSPHFDKRQKAQSGGRGGRPGRQTGPGVIIRDACPKSLPRGVVTERRGPGGGSVRSSRGPVAGPGGQKAGGAERADGSGGAPAGAAVSGVRDRSGAA